MVPSVIDRIRVGLHLTRLSINTYGTESFWRCLSWWHEETHVTIPRVEEEKKMGFELENMFGGEITTVDSPYQFGVNTSNSYVISASPSRPCITFGNGSGFELADNLLTLSVPGGSVGRWVWGGVSVKTTHVPNPIRRLVVKVLLGGEWVPDKKQGGEEILPAEYDRWANFVSEVQN